MATVGKRVSGVEPSFASLSLSPVFLQFRLVVLTSLGSSA